MHNPERPRYRAVEFGTLLVAAIVLITAIVAVPTPTRAQTAQPDRAQVVAFGRTVEALARTNAAAAIADLFVADEYTCPVDQMPWAQVCLDRPDGTVVDGYRVDRMQSEATVVDRTYLESTLMEFLADIPAGSATLRTVAMGAFGKCPACAAIVLAAAAPSSTAVPSLLLLQVYAAEDGLVVHSAIGGIIPAGGSALVMGGTWSSLEFLPVDADLGAPSTGSGTSRSSSLGAAPAVLATLALGAAIVLGGLVVVSRHRR